MTPRITTYVVLTSISLFKGALRRVMLCNAALRVEGRISAKCILLYDFHVESVGVQADILNY